jgi:hypothetical protein
MPHAPCGVHTSHMVAVNTVCTYVVSLQKSVNVMSAVSFEKRPASILSYPILSYRIVSYRIVSYRIKLVLVSCNVRSMPSNRGTNQSINQFSSKSIHAMKCMLFHFRRIIVAKKLRFSPRRFSSRVPKKCNRSDE